MTFTINILALFLCRWIVFICREYDHWCSIYRIALLGFIPESIHQKYCKTYWWGYICTNSPSALRACCNCFTLRVESVPTDISPVKRVTDFKKGSSIGILDILEYCDQHWSGDTWKRQEGGGNIAMTATHVQICKVGSDGCIGEGNLLVISNQHQWGRSGRYWPCIIWRFTKNLLLNNQRCASSSNHGPQMSAYLGTFQLMSWPSHIAQRRSYSGSIEGPAQFHSVICPQHSHKNGHWGGDPRSPGRRNWV